MNENIDNPAVDDVVDGVRKDLIDAVRNASHGLPWEAARRQWDVVGVDHDDEATGVCVCGQTSLAWLYTIGNRETGAVLHPIGSDCIGHFRSRGMDAAAHDLRQLRELAEIVQGGGDLVLNGCGRHLTKSKLAVLFEAGAFQPSQWNGGDPRVDLAFLLSMFRKRTALSAAQERKTSALLAEVATWLRSWGAEHLADDTVVVVPQDRGIRPGGIPPLPRPATPDAGAA